MTVKRFDCTNGGMHYCAGCYTMEEDTDGEYVRHEDYAKLEQQRAALVEACQRAFDQTDRTARPTDWEMLRAALRAAGVEL